MKSLLCGYVAVLLPLLSLSPAYGGEKEMESDPHDLAKVIEDGGIAPEEDVFEEFRAPFSAQPRQTGDTVENQARTQIKDQWLKLIIAEFVIEESGGHTLSILSEEIKRLNGKALGFSGMIFGNGIAQVEIKRKITLKDIPVGVLLNYISDEIKGTWTHYSGRVMVDLVSPDLGHGLRMDSEFLKMFGIERTDDNEQNLIKLVERLKEMGSLLQVSDFERVINDSYSVRATEREIEYLKSIIAILERGLVIRKQD